MYDLVTTMDPDIEFVYDQLESMPQSEEVEQSNWSTTDGTIEEDCNELLELAAQGGIKFVRATDDGRYEVITDSEARELMAQQNSHDIRILEGEEADAISELHRLQERAIEQQHQQRQDVVQDFNSTLVVMESSDTQDTVLNSFNGIEYFEQNKDERVLDHKTMDDHFVENITLLSQQPKMDDFIICPKTFEIDGVLSTEGIHDIIADERKKQDPTSIYTYQEELSQSLSNLQPSIAMLLDENQQHTIPTLDKTPLYSYSKNVHDLNENSNIWNNQNEQSVEKENSYSIAENLDLNYNTSSKADSIDGVGFSQTQIKITNGMEQQRIPYDDYVARDTGPSRIASDYDMFGSKNLILNDFMMSPYPEIKFLDDFARFSKGNGMSAINFGGLSADFDEMEDILMNATLERDKSDREDDSGFAEELSLSKILDTEKSLC